jgi:xanthine dehydrogenase YagT iron-sulfur-binding subunit
MTKDNTSDPPSNETGSVGPDRRTVLVGAATIVGATALPALVGGSANAALAETATAADQASSAVTIAARVNGGYHTLPIDPRTSLLDLLRERLALTGAKKGCDHGQCGACTVHLDGRRVVSCLTPAVHVDGREVTTIEGLTSSDGGLHPMQQAFIDHDALQCGYCTPGQIMAAVACVREGHATSPEQIREYMSGNICRCGAYVGIVAAIQDAAPKMERA